MTKINLCSSQYLRLIFKDKMRSTFVCQSRGSFRIQSDLQVTTEFHLDGLRLAPPTPDGRPMTGSRTAGTFNSAQCHIIRLILLGTVSTYFELKLKTEFQLRGAQYLQLISTARCRAWEEKRIIRHNHTQTPSPCWSMWRARGRAWFSLKNSVCWQCDWRARTCNCNRCSRHGHASRQVDQYRPRRGFRKHDLMYKMCDSNSDGLVQISPGHDDWTDRPLLFEKSVRKCGKRLGWTGIMYIATYSKPLPDPTHSTNSHVYRSRDKLSPRWSQSWFWGYWGQQSPQN